MSVERHPLVLVIVTFLIVVPIDFVVFSMLNVDILYAVPLLVAARYGAPRLIIGTAAAAVVLDVLSFWRDDEPLQLLPFTLAAFILIALLAVRVAQGREREARRAQEALAAQQQLMEFMGMVVHDLRGPLTIGQGYTDIARLKLQSGDLEAIGLALDRIDVAGHRMRRLIEDLLDSTRLGAGRFTIMRQMVDLVELTREVVDERTAGGTLYNFVVDTPARIVGEWDAERVRQVLTNLLSNAIQYSPEGTEIRVKAWQTDQSAFLSVADRGIGIAQDDIHLLFQPFSRLRDRDATGTGLGLYITQGIVQSHGGRMSVESQKGRGSTFTVELPFNEEPGHAKAVNP